MGGFRSQLQAFYLSSHTEELWYNSVVSLLITIYIYIYIYIYTHTHTHTLMWVSERPHWLLSTHWEKILSEKSSFQAVVGSILLYGCTTWRLTKRFEKKADGNCRRMLQAILNKSSKQHPTKQQLYGHLPPI